MSNLNYKVVIFIFENSHKESINNFLDNAIAVATDQVGQGRVLYMKPQNGKNS